MRKWDVVFILARRIILDTFRAQKTLERVWHEVQSVPLEGVEYLHEPEIRGMVKTLLDSPTLAFRYTLFTQVLAKVIDPRINCLALQVKANIPGSFDARSFCKKVVVPFERQKLFNVLGGSSDPYVGKPLRHEKISPAFASNVKNKEHWGLLCRLLTKVQEHRKREFVSQVFKQILLEIRRKLASGTPLVPHIQDVSVTQLKSILQMYLSRPSLGLRSQAIVYAFIHTMNEKLKTYKSVTTEKSTVSDAQKGRVADVECRDENGQLKLAVSVTDYLTLTKLENELEKAAKNRVENLLIIAHKIHIGSNEMEATMSKYPVNASVSQLVDFIVMFSVVLNSQMRKELVVRMYQVLQELEAFSDLKNWDIIVKQEL